jgi:hypothetical protein
MLGRDCNGQIPACSGLDVKGHLSSAAMAPTAATSNACLCGSTGRWRTVALMGFADNVLPLTSIWDGRIGRGANPPPQLGHTLARTLSTHCAQNVHSNEQISAWVLWAGNAVLQCSQLGLSSSMKVSMTLGISTGKPHRRLAQGAHYSATPPDFPAETGSISDTLGHPHEQLEFSSINYHWANRRDGQSRVHIESGRSCHH